MSVRRELWKAANRILRQDKKSKTTKRNKKKTPEKIRDILQRQSRKMQREFRRNWKITKRVRN